MPPITELTRIEPVHLARLEKQGMFTTGILLEVSETPTRRQYLADHVGGDPNDVVAWRDEALMLNLAGFGAGRAPAVHPGRASRACATSWRSTSTRSAPGSRRGATELNWSRPADLMVETWWEQARTLEEE